MKKLLLLFIISVSVKCVNAQSWCTPGAKWHYSAVSGVSGHNLIVEYSYTKDTTVQGKTCNVVQGVLAGTSYVDGYHNAYLPNYRKYLIRQENDVLYNYVGTGFDTIVDFSATAGDTWLYKFDCGIRTLSVTSTGTTTYKSSGSLRTVTAAFTYTYMNQSNALVIDTADLMFTEKLIMRGTWKDLFYRRCPIDPKIIYDGPLEYLCGYEDATLPLQMENLNGCGRYVGINEAEEVRNRLALFPNPAAGKLSVTIMEASSIHVVSSDGKLVRQVFAGTPGTHEINLSGLASGVYFVHTTSVSGIARGKLLVE